MATPPVKPAAPPPAPARVQGSVDPREHPPTPTPSGAVIIQNAPPLPAERPSMEGEQKPVLESSEVEQAAGKMAMDMWKKRQAAEEEAGKAALQRHAQTR